MRYDNQTNYIMGLLLSAMFPKKAIINTSQTRFKAGKHRSLEPSTVHGSKLTCVLKLYQDPHDAYYVTIMCPPLILYQNVY